MGCGSSRPPSVHKEKEAVKAMNLPGCFLATYKLQPKYEYSERHAVFVEEIKKVEGLPPPQPSYTSKEDIFDLKHYKDVDRRADRAPPKLLREPYSSLVSYLTSQARSELAKVRSIYRWITTQRLDTIPVPEVMPPSTIPLHQIWRIKNRKGNYAQLVSILCRMANIPCVIIHGVLKGSTYDVGQKLDDKAHYGEWNAVLVHHQWRLLNAYWGACALGSEGGDDWMEIDDGGEDEYEQKTNTNSTKEKEYVYVCDENYFLTDPRQLICTHFPAAREWQLLNEPVTMGQFERMAFLKDRFFNLGMSVISHPECVIHSQSGEVELSFGLPEEEASHLKFYYLLFRQETPADQTIKPAYDRYVFMHRPNKTELSVRVRSPVAGVFRLELVGRDVRVNDPTYDYDWVVLYKIRFHKAKAKCMPYPDMPTLGWGPTPYMEDLGLQSLTHHTGEVRAGQRGDAEISFTINDDTQMAKPAFFGKLRKPGMKDEQLKDRLIHRVEDGKIIFNVKLPKRGEYALSLNGFSKKARGKARNFANYMLVSEQKHYLEPFPPGFDQGVGQKPACDKFGLVPVSHPAGLIYTERDEVHITFRKTQQVDVSASVIGSEVVVSDSRRLVSESVHGDSLTFTIHLPRRGSYGVKIIGKTETSPTFESVYDYVIEFIRPINMADIRVEPDGREVLRPLRNQGVPKAPTPSIASSIGEEDSKEDEIRRRVDVAIEAEDEQELAGAAMELQQLGTERAMTEKTRVDHELNILNMKRDFFSAERDRDLKTLNHLISLCKERGYDKRMPAEMRHARQVQERLQLLERLMHEVRNLDQQTITEIRHYAHPPVMVHSVMMATLLLLGHFDNETKDWSRVLAIIGRTGRQALKKRCEELDMDNVALDVALGARQLLKDISLEQVRKVSVGAATFFIWTKGVVEELETRFSEDVANTRPRTSQSKSRGGRHRKHNNGLERL